MADDKPGVRPTTWQRDQMRDFGKDFPGFRDVVKTRFQPADQTMPSADSNVIKQSLMNDPVAGGQARAAFRPALETPAQSALTQFNRDFRPHEASFAEAGRSPIVNPLRQFQYGPNADPHAMGVASRSAFGTPMGPPERQGPPEMQGPRNVMGPPEPAGPRFPAGQRYAQPIGPGEVQGPPNMQGPRDNPLWRGMYGGRTHESTPTFDLSRVYGGPGPEVQGPPEAAGPRLPAGQRYTSPVGPENNPLWRGMYGGKTHTAPDPFDLSSVYGRPEMQGPPEAAGPHFPAGQRYAQPIGAPEMQGPLNVHGPVEMQGPRFPAGQRYAAPIGPEPLPRGPVSGVAAPALTLAGMMYGANEASKDPKSLVYRALSHSQPGRDMFDLKSYPTDMADIKNRGLDTTIALGELGRGLYNTAAHPIDSMKNAVVGNMNGLASAMARGYNYLHGNNERGIPRMPAGPMMIEAPMPTPRDGDPNSPFPDPLATPINKTPAKFAMDAEDATRQAKRPVAPAPAPRPQSAEDRYNAYWKAIAPEGLGEYNMRKARDYAINHTPAKDLAGHIGQIMSGSGAYEHSRAQAQQLPRQTDISLRNAMANERNADAAAKTAARPVADHRDPRKLQEGRILAGLQDQFAKDVPVLGYDAAMKKFAQNKQSLLDTRENQSRDETATEILERLAAQQGYKR